MKKLIIIAAVAVVAWAALVNRPAAGYDPADYARREAEAQRITQEAQIDAAIAPARAVAFNLAAILFALMLPIGAGMWGWAALLRYQNERRPDQRGVLPVAATDLRRLSPAALAEYHRSEQARAAIVPVPHTYSPHITYQHKSEGGLAPMSELETPAPALPDVATLADVLPSLAPGKLCYGVLPGGEPLTLTFGQAYHALAAGDTRTGKSNYLDSTIVQIHHQASRYKVRLLIGDFKREMAATWRRSALVKAVETDPAVIADMLLSLAHDEDGILARYSEFERLGAEQNRVIRNIGDWARVTRQSPPLTFCVIDELNALIEAADKRAELASALKVVLQTGAGAGVYVLGGAQYLTAKVFGRDGSKQFTTRALFGAYDSTAKGVVFGAGKLPDEQRAMLTGAPGRGLIRTAGQALPTAFQALRCDEEDILEAVHATGFATPRNDFTAPATGATKTVELAQMPERAELVRRLRACGVGKVKIIEAVWNVKPGGGSVGYQKASAAYDAIVGGVE
jgi:hypothetical protein